MTPCLRGHSAFGFCTDLFDSEQTHSDMMWGDAGRLYTRIADEDLRARRFENHRLIVPCC